MQVLKRLKSNKPASAKNFNRNVGKTKAANLRQGPMRGGIRL